MTELQWLIKMLTKKKLSPALKDMFIERIGEVEASLIPRSSNGRTSGFGPENVGSIPARGTNQSPSTQKILDEMAQEGITLGLNSSTVNPPINVPTLSAHMPITRIPIPPVAIDKETGRAMVNTGKGTAGPRKF